MKLWISTILVIFLFYSCIEGESVNQPTTQYSIHETFWVFPNKLPSEFETSGKEYYYLLFQNDLDYRIKKATSTAIEENWIRMEEDFDILGFNFEPGYFYKLSVLKSDSKKPLYKLIRMEEKLKDYSYLLNGIWTIKSINAIPNLAGGTVSFRSKDRSFRISSKCTAVRIRIGAMDESNFSQADEFFDFYNGSKICFGDNMPSITSSFRLSRKYQLIDGQSLVFKDSVGNEVLELHR